MIQKSLQLIGIGLLFAVPAFAAGDDACSVPSTVSDVQLTLALDSDHAVFQTGEVIPLVLAFSSTTAGRYQISNRSYDRSGRLDSEVYCLEPEAPDPLASYFRNSMFLLGGGLFNSEGVGTKPFIAQADLNEFRTLTPGHYRLYAISGRVSRPRDAKEETPSDEVAVRVRSNAVEFDVKPASRAWQRRQLAEAMQQLAGPAPSANSQAGRAYADATRKAARQLRFLNTADSTKALAEIFSGRDSEQPNAWELAFGLYGSPYRKVAIEAMHQQIAHPGHVVTPDFLQLLVGLEIDADAAWNVPESSGNPEDGQVMTAFWKRRQEHVEELLKPLAEEALAALPRKTGRARALTALGLLSSPTIDPAAMRPVRRALIASWSDLPANTRDTLIEYQWSYVFGKDRDAESDASLLGILMPLVAPPAPGRDFYPTMVRDAALKRIYEIDPSIALPILLRDLRDARTQPDLALIKLLPQGEIEAVIPAAVDRITRNEARPLDYTLVDRYADTGVLASIQATFEQELSKWNCVPQEEMLRYFLRVAPEYGAAEVAASLRARNDTGCYRMLLRGLGDQLPHAEASAIEALNDPDAEVTRDAIEALRRWGTSAAEAPLWARLERLHQEWADRVDEMRSSAGDVTEGSRAAGLEEGLVTTIAEGTGWFCTGDKLVRLRDLTLTSGQRMQVQSWIDSDKQGQLRVDPIWTPDQEPTFDLGRSAQLTEEQLKAKVALLPRGSKVEWEFWQPGQITPPVSMEMQDAAFDRLRAAAEAHGITLVKANYPAQ